MSFIGKPPLSVANASIDWEEITQNLLDYETVVIGGVVIRGTSLKPDQPVWAQVRRILRQHGIQAPRRP
jgi:hypothetical protein